MDVYTQIFKNPPKKEKESMAKRNKKMSSAVAIATAAAMLLGGTFAWQSISQVALNEASAVVNPGGRLHDDFDGTNKDIYVENFADENIFARVRLEEYFEIVPYKATPTVIAGYTDDAGQKIGTIHYFDGTDLTTDYWKWTTGGETIYMPTFNKNKDSLAADINGTYAGSDNNPDTPEDKYLDYTSYTDGESLTAIASYDGDANNDDEGNVITQTEEHFAKSTGGATLISMAQWMALPEDEKVGRYWVYDTDGWVYWAQPIASGETTGLLLDKIELAQVMDDSWYYGINVVGQFITANDLGSEDMTGFYADGETVTDNALVLLKTIGVEVPGTDDNEGGNEQGGGAGGNTPSEMANVITFAGVQPNEANMIATGDTVLTIHNGDGTPYDLSANSNYRLAVTLDNEYWYIYSDAWTDGAFNASNLLANTNTAFDIRFAVADISGSPGIGSNLSLIDASNLVWVSDETYYIYHGDKHQYVQTYAYGGNNYFVLVDLMDGDGTLCVIDSTKYIGNDPMKGHLIYNTEMTSVETIDWAGLTG